MAEASVRVCPKCGANNRIPMRHLAHKGRCGACKTELAASSDPIDVRTPAEFDAIVGGVETPVLIDFWAPWCGPCRMAAPGVAEVARSLAGKCVVLKVNSDDHPDLAGRFSVRGIPHFVVLKQGRQVAAQSGLMDAARLRRWVEAHA